ncbi:MAG: hypothetical protein MI867_16235 [Pseudomonadales bacterium]|nr:hypothetical protein [Pseudomonadales bacterium]
MASQSAETNNNKQAPGWPMSAIVSLVALLIVSVVFMWVFNQQQMMLKDVQAIAAESQTQQDKMQKQFLKFVQNLQDDRRQQMDFVVKQQHYSALMGQLSEMSMNTERQDGTALEETVHRINQAYFGLEPFLDEEQRTWLAKQLKALANLSAKLADPAQEYEENLLATKTSLRQMIDETHLNLYPALFSPQETEIEAPVAAP